MCPGIFLDGEYKDKNAKFSFSCDLFMAKVYMDPSQISVG